MIEQVFNPNFYSYNPYAIPMFLTSAAILFLGVLPLLRKRSLTGNVSFFLVTLAGSLWFFGFGGMSCVIYPNSPEYSAANKDVLEAVALWWAKVGYLGIVFIPPFVYSFVLRFLRLYLQYKMWTRASFLLSTVFAGLIIGTNALIEGVYAYPWGYYPRAGQFLLFPFLISFLGMLMISLGKCWIEYRKAEPGTRKLRIRSFLITFGVAYLGSFDYLATFGVKVYPFGYVPLLIFVILTALTIQHYRLGITPLFAVDQIVATMNDPLIACDAEGRIQFTNPAVHSVLGYMSRELHKAPIECLADASSAKRIREMLLSEEPGRNEEMVFHTKKRETVDVSISIAHLQDWDGVPIGAVIIARDIREYKQVEKKRAYALGLANERATELEALHKATLALISAESLEEQLNTILHATCEMTKTDRGQVVAIDVNSGELKASVIQGPENQQKRKIEEYGIIRKVVETRKPLIIGDVSKVDFYTECWADTTSELAMPILYDENEILGVLNIESVNVDAFKEHTLDKL